MDCKNPKSSPSNYFKELMLNIEIDPGVQQVLSTINLNGSHYLTAEPRKLVPLTKYSKMFSLKPDFVLSSSDFGAKRIKNLLRFQNLLSELSHLEKLVFLVLTELIFFEKSRFYKYFRTMKRSFDYSRLSKEQIHLIPNKYLQGLLLWEKKESRKSFNLMSGLMIEGVLGLQMKKDTDSFEPIRVRLGRTFPNLFGDEMNHKDDFWFNFFCEGKRIVCSRAFQKKGVCKGTPSIDLLPIIDSCDHNFFSNFFCLESSTQLVHYREADQVNLVKHFCSKFSTYKKPLLSEKTFLLIYEHPLLSVLFGLYSRGFLDFETIEYLEPFHFDSESDSMDIISRNNPKVLQMYSTLKKVMVLEAELFDPKKLFKIPQYSRSPQTPEKWSVIRRSLFPANFKDHRVFINYGERTNWDFLSNYGFVPKNNPFHTIYFRFNLAKLEKTVSLISDNLQKTNTLFKLKTSKVRDAILLGFKPESANSTTCLNEIIESSSFFFNSIILDCDFFQFIFELFMENIPSLKEDKRKSLSFYQTITFVKSRLFFLNKIKIFSFF